MRWYRVPAALALAGTLFAPASPASSAVLITVDKAAQQMTVVVDGELRWTWPVSTGLTKYDTPNGRYGAFRMARKHFSREWDDAPMPHSIFFTQNGHAIHGSYAVRRLGNAASHGCVRLAPKNAAQLFGLVQKHGLGNTLVLVQGALPGSVPTPIIAIPLPRERRAAAQMMAKLEAPHVVRDDASTTVESKPGAVAAAAALPGQERPTEELMASAQVGAQVAASARIVARPHDTRAAFFTAANSDAHVAVRPDLSTIAESRAEVAAIATLKPEEPVEGRTANARLTQSSEHSTDLYEAADPANPVILSELPAIARAESGKTVIATLSQEVSAAEQQEAPRAMRDPLPRQAARALARPHALPAPPSQGRAAREPPRQRAERKQPPRYAERTYDDPPDYRRSWQAEPPPVYYRARPRFAPRVYYGPPDEIIEEFYVNGQWVRRRYYRQAQPSDFYGYR